MYCRAGGIEIYGLKVEDGDRNICKCILDLRVFASCLSIYGWRMHELLDTCNRTMEIQEGVSKRCCS